MSSMKRACGFVCIGVFGHCLRYGWTLIYAGTVMRCSALVGLGIGINLCASLCGQLSQTLLKSHRNR